MTIKFYNRENPYYNFTNFAPGFPIKIKLKKITPEGYLVDDPSQPEREFPTSEHLFQAMKFWDKPAIVDEIINDPSPSHALYLGGERNGIYYREIPSHWSKAKLNAMEWVLQQKFKSHPDLKDLLLGTGSEELIEDVESGHPDPRTGCKRQDWFWGNSPKPDGNPGENNLGKLLIKIRAELLIEKKIAEFNEKNTSFLIFNAADMNFIKISGLTEHVSTGIGHREIPSHENYQIVSETLKDLLKKKIEKKLGRNLEDWDLSDSGSINSINFEGGGRRNFNFN